MKICHVVDYFHPYMGYQENHLALIQAKEGHDVFVLTSNLYTPWGDRDSIEFQERIIRGDITLKREKGIRVIRHSSYFEYSHRIWLKNLKSSLRELKPDFVHVHGYATLNACAVSLIKKKLNYTLLIDDHMLFNAISNPFAFMFYPVFRATASLYLKKKADRLVSVSSETTAFMSQKYGISRSRIEEIPLGVDLDSFHQDEDTRNQMRQKFSIESEEIVLIYTGKFDSKKDPIILLKAAKKLLEDKQKIKVIFVGSGSEEYVKSLKNFTQQNSMNSYVIFHNAVPSRELASFFNMADIAIWPRQSSMSALEAMACGIPVILCDTPVNRDRLSKYSGLVYQDKNIQDLCLKIKKISVDPDVRKKMSKNGIEYTKKLDWQLICQRTLHGSNK